MGWYKAISIRFILRIKCKRLKKGTHSQKYKLKFILSRQTSGSTRLQSKENNEYICIYITFQFNSHLI